MSQLPDDPVTIPALDPCSFLAWRQRLGLSQSDAGRLLGVTTQVIWRYESGWIARIPPPVVRLCWLLTHPRVYEGYCAALGFVRQRRGPKPRPVAAPEEMAYGAVAD